MGREIGGGQRKIMIGRGRWGSWYYEGKTGETLKVMDSRKKHTFHSLKDKGRWEKKRGGEKGQGVF